MSEARRLEPSGAGGESRPVTVDLTRIDIRRGTLNLPRRLQGNLPEGELRARDTASGVEFAVLFTPPRQLEGLAEFFQKYDLRPNDAVSLRVGDELLLTPVRRERRQAPQPARPEARHVPAPESAAPDPAPLVSPPPPTNLGGWQDVLHDPAPRRGMAGGEGGKGAERERRGPSAPHFEERGTDGGQADDRQRQSHDAPRGVERPDDSVTIVRERRRPEQASRPLAPRADLPAREEARPSGPTAGTANEAARPQDVSRLEARRQPPAEPTRRPTEEPQAQREPEPVAVGAASAGDVVGSVSRYLRDPGTPAIVRAGNVAEALRLPVEDVQRALADVAKNSEGAVAPIRPGVYLVKRGR